MSDTVVEKSFLYLVLFSLVLHAVVFFLMQALPQEKRSALTEPFMVDLSDLPAVQPPKAVEPPVRRYADESRRVEREAAPKGDTLRDQFSPGVPSVKAPSGPTVSREPAGRAEKALPVRPESAGREPSPKEELFRKKPALPPPDTIALYPGSARMARIEESYRKKYGPEVAEGETRFLNTDDIQFGSFLRRFETSIYGVWRYPTEAARMGIEGMTPVRITFNRRGEIVGRELLQSSGSKILDNEVLRTLEQVGPIGGFPKGYDKETFKLIAFFHYGIMQGGTRSLR